LDLERA
jgi:hypothetical protein